MEIFFFLTLDKFGFNHSYESISRFFLLDMEFRFPLQFLKILFLIFVEIKTRIKNLPEIQ